MLSQRNRILGVLAAGVIAAASVFIYSSGWMASPTRAPVEEKEASPAEAAPARRCCKDGGPDIEQMDGGGCCGGNAVEVMNERLLRVPPGFGSSESSDSTPPRNDEDEQASLEDDSGFINPALYPCHVKTYGCTHNTSDSETLKGVLASSGFPLTEDMESARVVVLNSCTVKNPSQESAINTARRCRERGQFVVLAGCVVQADVEIQALQDFSCIGVKQLDKVAEAVLETVVGNNYRMLSTAGNLPSLSLPRVRKSAIVEIIPLSIGCLGACTYCKTRFARGMLKSYSKEVILQRLREAVADGCQQIWLSSEDTGAWGIDLGENVCDLLSALDEELRSNPDATNVMCRLGMTNPPYILEHLDKIAQILRGPNWFRFLHIPVQSGSDVVLANMKREYTRADFELCLDRLLTAIPDLTIATDFICGFPKETDEDHKASLDLLMKYKMQAVNISQFYSRPGTSAAQMRKVPSKVVKQRSSEMTDLIKSYESFGVYVNRVMEVWIDGKSERSSHFVGRTRQYVKVLLDDSFDLKIGSKIVAKIIDAKKWHVVGEPLDQS